MTLRDRNQVPYSRVIIMERKVTRIHPKHLIAAAMVSDCNGLWPIASVRARAAQGNGLQSRTVIGSNPIGRSGLYLAAPR